MDYSINTLKDKLEEEERCIVSTSETMRNITQQNIEDLELAIHNLEQLNNL